MKAAITPPAKGLANVRNDRKDKQDIAKLVPKAHTGIIGIGFRPSNHKQNLDPGHDDHRHGVTSNIRL